MTIYNDYLKYTEKYKKIYGEKTLVLMQVGSFFECYGLVDKNDEKIFFGSEIMNFSKICDMTISKKSGCNCDGYNVVMAGFGTQQIEKYIRKLQENSYTIVVFTQDNNIKNTSRSLYGIYSPGTYFGNDNDDVLSNNITCIWLHYIKNDIITKKENITIGISNIDILTGKTSINEFTHGYFNNPTTFDQLEKYIAIYKPSEVILITNMEKETEIFDNVINYTNMQSIKIHKIYINNKHNVKEFKTTTKFTNSNEKFSSLIEYAKNCEKQKYQEELLQKYYKNSQYSVDFNKYCIATQSFCFLLDFVNSHNSNLVNNISYPIFENLTDKLVLANHSLKQLNILSDERYNGKYSCILNLLDNNITNIGKRKFTYELLNPITNIEKLKDNYNLTEFLLKNNNYCSIRNNLNSIKDIEKFQRKLNIKKISPRDFYILYNNLCEIENIYNSELFSNNKNILFKYLTKYSLDYNKLLDLCKSIKLFVVSNFNIENSKNINIERLANYEITELDFINKNVSDELNYKLKNSVDAQDQLECIRNYLSSLLIKVEKNNKTNDFVKLHETSKTEASLILTKRRGVILENEIKKILSNDIKNIELKYTSKFTKQEEILDLNLTTFIFKNHGTNNSNLVILNNQINIITNNMQNSKDELTSYLMLTYNKIINNFIKFLEYDNNIYNKTKLDVIIDFIGIIDNEQNKCYIASNYNYSKPNIVENSDKSFVNFKKMRHPLIEHLNTKELYVTNDLAIGLKDDKNGILLYGTNAVGKTSFIKSIGICIIMAQSGLYVPCSNFDYYPYNYLFTRILGNDNIFKGLSTFAVEMSELRTILNNANKNSIILGDELCSGTESTSALSIFVSGLEVINNIGSSYIFATHFHEILDYDEIKYLTSNNMSIYHMSVIFDREKNKLIYDRKLKPGGGDTMYGLEVCKSLDLPYEFLSRAYEIRKKYNSNINSESVLDKGVSNYNSKKIKNLLCEICRKNKASDIHHLQFQKNADNNNIINNEFHKNSLANLINICDDCHSDIHKNDKELLYKKTSHGYELFEKDNLELV